jgi:hypothetical protein
MRDIKKLRKMSRFGGIKRGEKFVVFRHFCENALYRLGRQTQNPPKYTVFKPPPAQFPDPPFFGFVVSLFCVRMSENRIFMLGVGF